MIKLLETIIIKRRTNFLHKRVVKIKVMHNAQPHTEHFSAFEQMVHIRTRKSAAGRTLTADFERRIVSFVLSIIKIHNAVHRENLPVPCVS